MSLSAEAFERAPLLDLFAEADGVVSRANPCALEILGAGIVGAPAERIFTRFGEPPPDLASFRADPHEPRLLSVNAADQRPESFRFLFLPEAGGTRILGFADALEQRKLTRELLALNLSLGSLTRELQKKNHELAELNRLKDRFLGMAAHDLRKPVSAVLNYAEFLLDEAGGALDEEHRGFLRTILDSTTLMRGIIDDFLDLVVIESGSLAPRRAPADLRAVARRCADLIGVLARRRGVRLTLRLPGDPLTLDIDANKIEQVLNNLLSNAVEHSPDGAEVRVTASPDGGGALLEVADDGPGLAPEDAVRLFEPYARGPAVKKGGARSTGLGLFISKKIVEAHGGNLWVESAPGRGARFLFRLPAAPSEEKERMTAHDDPR